MSPRLLSSYNFFLCHCRIGLFKKIITHLSNIFDEYLKCVHTPTFCEMMSQVRNNNLPMHFPSHRINGISGIWTVKCDVSSCYSFYRSNRSYKGRTYKIFTKISSLRSRKRLIFLLYSLLVLKLYYWDQTKYCRYGNSLRSKRTALGQFIYKSARAQWK